MMIFSVDSTESREKNKINLVVKYCPKWNLISGISDFPVVLHSTPVLVYHVLSVTDI